MSGQPFVPICRNDGCGRWIRKPGSSRERYLWLFGAPCSCREPDPTPIPDNAYDAR